MTAKTFRIAVAQPLLITEPDRGGNVVRAVELTARAAALGAQFVLFPEGSPGPHEAQFSYDAEPALAAAARESGIAVCWSRVESCADGHHRLVVHVHDSAGERIVRHERAHPATIHAQELGSWIAPGPSLCSFDLATPGGLVRLGIVVCSELWIPEPARVLALRGVQVICSPAGGAFTTLAANWHIIARARAIENLCYVALTNNLYGGEVGSAMIAGPEHVLAASGTEELIVATLDLDRSTWLRDRDDSMVEPKPFMSIPGLTRARRPELYGELSAPMEGLYDYNSEQIVAVEVAP